MLCPISGSCRVTDILTTYAVLQMGLGKTIQSLSLILSRPHPKYPISEDAPRYADMSPNSKSAAAKIPKEVGRGTLVVAPLALIKQWEAEIERRTEPSHRLRVLVHHGPNRARDPRALRKYDVVITTYDVIRSEHSQSSSASDGQVDAVGTFGIRWWRIICDEAHTIKNRTAKVSLAACALQARHRWCLTGTPLQNNLDELYSLFKFLRIQPMSDYAVWKEQISRPIQKGRGKIAINRLRVILSAVMLRRTKDVLKKDAEGKSGHQIKLPERCQEKVVGKFDAREQAFYNKLEERTEESLEKMMARFDGGDVGAKPGGGVSMTSALVLLLRLRQACNHPHLLAGKIHRDKDSGIGLATPRKKKAAKTMDDAAEDDELAGLMGGLSVNQRKCEVCVTDLTRQEIDDGHVRCTACDENLEGITKSLGRKHKDLSKGRKEKRGKKKVQKRRRPTVFDSDEEAEGEEGSQAEDGSDTENDGDDDDKPDDPFAAREEGYIDSQAEESEGEDGDGDDNVGSEYEGDDEELSYSRLLPSTKISGLLTIIKKEVKERNKIIVFSQFTSMLDLIEPFLQQMRVAFTRYDGSMKNDLREASLRRLRGEGEFASGRDKDWCGVLLCSLRCGALGLNLTCASRVVILEPFWNPVRASFLSFLRLAVPVLFRIRVTNSISTTVHRRASHRPGPSDRAREGRDCLQAYDRKFGRRADPATARSQARAGESGNWRRGYGEQGQGSQDEHEGHSVPVQARCRARGSGCRRGRPEREDQDPEGEAAGAGGGGGSERGQIPDAAGDCGSGGEEGKGAGQCLWQEMKTVTIGDRFVAPGVMEWIFGTMALVDAEIRFALICYPRHHTQLHLVTITLDLGTQIAGVGSSIPRTVISAIAPAADTMRKF